MNNMSFRTNNMSFRMNNMSFRTNVRNLKLLILGTPRFLAIARNDKKEYYDTV